MSGAANLRDPEFDPPSDRPGYSYRRARLGWQSGATRLGASLYEIEPGSAPFPYHWHGTNEEILIVLEGEPALRTDTGRRTLSCGAVIAFPPGPDGAHQVINDSSTPVRVMMLSTMIAPETSGYPDSGKTGVMLRAPGAEGGGGQRFWCDDDEVDYWDGEPGPQAHPGS